VMRKRVSKVVRLSEREFNDFSIVRDGAHLFQAMAAGCELDLFTYLSRHPNSSPGSIAEHLGITDYTTRILLFALAAARLVKRGRGAVGTYSNSKAAEKFLSTDSPYCMIPVIRRTREIYYHPLYHVLDAVKAGSNVGLDAIPGKGGTIYERLAQDPAREKIFHAATSSTSAMFTPHLAMIKELKRVKHLVDLGGGTGTHAIELAKFFPSLKITIYELPSLCAKADANIAKHGLSDRVKTFAGDFFNDPFPADCDCLFMSHLNVIWSEELNIKLFERCYQALPENGIIVCYNLMADNNETNPPSAAAMSLFFLTLASGNGMTYPLRSYIDWFKRAGFRHKKTYRITEPYTHAIVIGQK
jgi:L-tyrosine C(3)-methyltransferase